MEAEDEVTRRVLVRNKEAMELLRLGKQREALKVLKDAQSILSESSESSDPSLLAKLQAITLNNLGCYYKRTNRPLHALKYLSHALHLESRPPVDYINLAGTHLNICALKSQLGEHESALSEANLALEILIQNPSPSPNSLVTLAIAYNNAGTELEFLNKIAQALDVFKTGWDFAKTELGETHPMAESLCKSYYRMLELRAGKPHRLKSRTTSGASFDSSQGGDFPLKLGQINEKPKSDRALVAKNRPKGREKSHISQPPSVFPSPDRPSLHGYKEVRFITGERLKPMFKLPIQHGFRSVRPGNGVENEGNREKESAGTRKVFKKVTRGGAEDRVLKKKKLPWRFDPITEHISGKSRGKRGIMTTETAAIIIQKWIRMFLARKKYLRHRAAAPRPKAFVPVPKSIHFPPIPSILGKKDHKTTLFASPSKRKSTQITEKEAKIERKISEIEAQACIRGFIVRKQLGLKRDSAVFIQKHVRRYQCRTLYVGIRAAVVCIQKWWRGVRGKLGRKGKKRRAPRSRFSY